MSCLLITTIGYLSTASQCGDTLPQCIITDAEFQTVAADTLTEFGSRQKESHSFVGESQEEGRRGQVVCRLCKTKNHPLWFCNEVKQKSPAEHWHVAKHLASCNHRGGDCTYSRRCGINSCQESHNRLLHSDSSRGYKREDRNNSGPPNDQHPTLSGTEGSRKQPQSIHTQQQCKHQ